MGRVWEVTTELAPEVLSVYLYAATQFVLALVWKAVHWQNLGVLSRPNLRVDAAATSQHPRTQSRSFSPLASRDSSTPSFLTRGHVLKHLLIEN